MKKSMIAAVVLASITLSACGVSKSTLGTLGGGVAGGVIGSQVGGGSGRTVAIIGGTLLGAMAGNYVGGQLDELDRRKAQDALERTPTGQTTSWVNPDSGDRYAVTPTRTYEDSRAGVCRDFDMNVVMDGKSEVVKGTACRDSRGEWINQ